VREAVGVREFGEGVQKQKEAVRGLELPDPPPPPGGEPVPTEPRRIPIPGPAEVIVNLLKEIPEPWAPTADDLAFLQKDVSIGKAKVAKGVPLSESVRRMMAEESAARAYAGVEDTFEFPWWIFALPLIREAFTKLKLSPFGPRMVPADFQQARGPGGRTQGTQLTRDIAGASGASGRGNFGKGTGGTASPRTGGPAGGGKHIDARTLMQNVTNVGRRSVRPNRQQDPNL